MYALSGSHGRARGHSVRPSFLSQLYHEASCEYSGGALLCRLQSHGMCIPDFRLLPFLSLIIHSKQQQLQQSELIHLPKKEDKPGVAVAPLVPRFNENNEALPWKSSTKIDALMRDLYTVNERDPTIKSIVFSQWTSMVCPYY